MVDFSKLKRPNRAEMEAPGLQRREREIQQDHDKRLSYCKHEILVVLTYEAEVRFTTTGAQRASFHGTDSDGREVRAIWFAPDHLNRDEIDALAERMTEGAQLILKGYWARETYGDRPFTFKAQFVELSSS